MKTNKKAQAGIIAIILIILLIILLGLGYFYFYGGNNPEPITTPKNTVTSDNQPSTNAKTYTIDIKNFAFSPSSLTINKGDTIKWTNSDSAPHTVTSDSGNELDSSSLATGQSYSHTFTNSGEYDYYCKIHPSMKGKVIVQ